MPLVPCRACGHQVDTSALACPGCGATDPAKKISRQVRDLRKNIITSIVWILILMIASIVVWKTVIPAAKHYLTRTMAESRSEN